MRQAELADVAAGLEHLALKVVMLDEGDVAALGAFLAEIDRLKPLFDSLGEESALLVLEHLERVGNGLVLRELDNAVAGLEMLNQGVTLLLDWARAGDWVAVRPAWDSFQRLASADAPPASLSPPLDFVNDPELVGGFLLEAQEHLEGIETRLVFLEQNPEDLEAINAIFRPFHTIKGVAGFLQLTQIQEASHEVESVLDQVRSGHLIVSPDLVNLVLAAVDLLKEMLADLREALAQGRPVTLFDLGPLKAGIAQVAQPATDGPRLGEILMDRGELEAEELEEALEIQRAQEQPRPLGEILVEDGRVPPQKVAQALVQQLGKTRPASEGPAAETVKVDLAKVDNLVDLMGELVIVQSQVRQNPQILALADQKLTRDLGQMARITSELQKISMSMRMIPIGATFRKMVRLVRDLSQKVKKSVALHLEGEDTEIDRNMVETIYDPLVHLVRNAVDHGLETPEERRAAGKNPEGSLWLRAYHKGGNIIIEIEDDGRGLDREAILAKARGRGLVADGDQLSAAQVDYLIFQPGFSTAPEVTDISGRGVGLDVVGQTVERLRGKIEISSHPGEGCRLTLRLPLTLAIIDGMVVKVGEERYVLPTVGVRETLRPSGDDYFTVSGKGELIRVRDRLLPLVRLHRLFEVGEADISPTAALVMVVEHEGEQRALLVDEILGKQEVVIKSLGHVFQKLSGLAGGTILGDGRVGLILDLAGLMELEKGNAREHTRRMMT